MGKCIGIDLGTTNSVAAIKDREVHVLQNRQSSDLTRSVVGEYKKQKLVGQPALDRQLLAPQDTIESVKRLMGRGFRDENVQRLKKQAAYSIVVPSDGTDDDVRVIMCGVEYSPIEISSMILKKVKEDAEYRLNDNVEYAVITVPAYFTDKQIDATRKAGQMAGLKVQKIMTEPTAAAYAFGVSNLGEEDSKTILVYDLGGGTFDVSVMTIVGGVFVSLNVEGDMWLGGDDFDRKIMDHVLQHVSVLYGIDGAADPQFMVKLKEKAEQAKKALSSGTLTEITIPNILKDDEGNLVSVELEMSRMEFERMIAKDVARSMEIVLKAIKGAGEAMTPDQIDHVLLVGGSSYIPLVQASLAEIFGKGKLLTDVDPMKCVAYGAAILSAKCMEEIECPKGHVNPGTNTTCGECGAVLVLEHVGGTIVDITPMNYGIRTVAETIKCSNGHENPGKNQRCYIEECGEELVGADDKYEMVIPKGTSLPMQKSAKKRFRTSAMNLKRLRVPIYAGSDPVASKNELQATVWLELPDHVPEDTPVDVSLSLDSDGVLRVLVELLDGSGTKVESIIDRGNTLRSQLENKLDSLKRQINHIHSSLDPEAEKKLEELYVKAIKALNDKDTTIAGSCAKQMEELLLSGDPAWKKKAQGICGYTEIILEHSFLLDPPKTQQLKTLVKELQSCIDRNDESAAGKKYVELDKATDDVPDNVKFIMVLIKAISIANENNLAVEAEKMRVALSEIESALREKNYDRVNEVVNRIDDTLTKIFKSTGQNINTLIKGNNEGLLKA